MAMFELSIMESQGAALKDGMLGMVQTDQNRHLLGANANTPYFEHLMAPPSWASTGHISARPWLAGSQGKVESKRTYYMIAAIHLGWPH